MDINSVLYLQGRIVEVVKTEIVDPAIDTGYKNHSCRHFTWWARCPVIRHESVPGYLRCCSHGTFSWRIFFNDVIQSAGGLSRWEECPPIEWDYACNMWKLLTDYLSVSENPNKIILSFGLEDGFAESNQLLANQLPARNAAYLADMTGSPGRPYGGRCWIIIMWPALASPVPTVTSRCCGLMRGVDLKSAHLFYLWVF